MSSPSPPSSPHHGSSPEPVPPPKQEISLTQGPMNTPPGGLVARPLSWRVVVASPVLYGVFIPLVFLDVCLALYHWTVFPLLQIPTVQRSSYIRLDRHRLAYLPFMVKLTCTYCGYANGLLQYAVRLAGDTEAYFCPIKHQQRTKEFHDPPHHDYFAEYGDVQGFQHRYTRPPNKQT